MIEATATRLALMSGWSFTQELHTRQATQALEAAKVPQLIDRLNELEDSISKAEDILVWAVGMLGNVRAGTFNVAELDSMPELLPGEPDG